MREGEEREKEEVKRNGKKRDKNEEREKAIRIVKESAENSREEDEKK